MTARQSLALAVAGLLSVASAAAPSVAAEPNAAPIAVDDPNPSCQVPAYGGMYPIPEDPKEPAVLAIGCSPLANDTDADGDILLPELVTDAEHGAATVWGDPDGSFSFATYLPDDDFNTGWGDQPGGAWDSDRFTYRATDGTAWSNNATYRVWIAPVNDAPTFTPGPELVSVAQDTGEHSGQWATDISPGPYESDQHLHFEVTRVRVDGVPNLFVVDPAIDNDGVLTFTPGPGEIGLSQVTVQAVDDGGLEDWNLASQLRELPDDTSDEVTFQIAVMPDSTPPTVGSLASVLPAQAIGATSVRVALGWQGSDAGSGVESYRLERRIGGGAWTPVAPSGTSATTVTTTLTLGTAYGFRARATDAAGNVGPWATFPVLTPTRIQSSSSLVTYTGAWSRVTGSSLSGGSARYATSSTRRAKVSFTGREVALVATRRTTGGHAKVLIDGVQVATINLDAAATQYRRIVFRRGFAAGGRHSIEIRPVGDGRVEVDAFIVLR